MIPLDSRIARWAPIPLRLIVGYGFMAHGFAKLARGPEAFPAILHALGVPAPHFLAWAVPSAPGAAASESGRLCYGDGARGGRPRPERASCCLRSPWIASGGGVEMTSS